MTSVSSSKSIDRSAPPAGPSTLRLRNLYWFFFSLSLFTLAPTSPAGAMVDPSTARHLAAQWLADHQNPDGSWGEGSTRMLVTAETVLALAASGEVVRSWTVTQRGAAWLLANETVTTDFEARRIRAVAAARGQTAALAELGQQALLLVALGNTLGPELRRVTDLPNAYDTALVIGAVRAASSAVSLVAAANQVIARRREDQGWSGDFVPAAAGPSDLTVTAEVVRAIATQVPTPTLQPSLARLSSAPLGSTLEIAARLAALHEATGVAQPALQNALLDASRFQNGGVWSTDPFVNAMGLLALSTNPSAPAFTATPGGDTDGDGLRDAIDPDIDGDGVPNPLDAFPFNPLESANTDGDILGDLADPDDDNDGVPDAAELMAGTDPRSNDSDRDGIPDLGDACPLDSGASFDSDGDGVCDGRDACPLDPLEVADLDGDGLCDLADADDDNDGFSDLDELAYGSDPRSASSIPGSLPPDFDGDGIPNDSEMVFGLSPFRADTDNDGALDLAEVFQGGFVAALDATVQPRPVIAVAAGGGTRSSVSNLVSAATTGQPTPVALSGGASPRSTGAGIVNLAGFQAQAGLGRDLDGDGLRGQSEWARGASDLLVDSDGDGFVDGFDGRLPVAAVIAARDLDGDGFADGEGDVGTSPSDPSDRPGKPGDVAPLGQPDGRLTAADVAVCRRIAVEPGILDLLSLPQQREIALEASDVLAPPGPGPEDVSWIRGQSPAGGLPAFVP